MATDLVVNQAINDIARAVVGLASLDYDLYLHLYVNSHTLAVGDTVSALTECSAPGYSSIHVGSSNWSGSTSAGVATYTAATQTFTLTGPGSPAQTIYGHYWTNGASGPLVWGQTWGSSFAIPAGGAIVAVTPEWQDQNC